MDKRTILAFVLIALVVIFWDDYLKLMGYAPEPAAIDSTAVVGDSNAGDSGLPVPQKTKTKTPDSQLDLTTPEQASATDISTRYEVGDTTKREETVLPEQFIYVETPLFKAKISTHGAGLVSYKLKPSRYYLKQDIELIPDWGPPRVAGRFWTYEGPLDTDKLQYYIEGYEADSPKKITLKPGQEKTLTLVTNLHQGGTLSVNYTFYGDGFSFLYDISTSANGEIWVRPEAELYWRYGLAFTEPDPRQETYYSKAYVYYSGDILETMKVDTKENKLEGPATGETKWAAIRNKYFMTALIPEESPATGAWMESLHDSLKKYENPPNYLGVGLMVPIENSEPITPIRVFMGPLDDEILESVDPSLKQAMTWGAGIGFIDAILSPISRLVLWSLKALHKLIPNYGICIIIFSILVKIVIWPLTRKSYQSMAAMGALKPEMDKIREKHKDDPQRLNKEIMGLYKKHKVNPAGGCLPMLLQMPLLYALFIIFRATIEFRRAPFVGWINDLSLPDAVFDLPFSVPLYGDYVAILPIVMAVTSFLQSKQTITDPNQKFMIYFMPIFMMLIFNQFPSGLTLYYTLFNVWTVLQQKITPPPKPAEVNDNKGSSGAKFPKKR